MVEENADNYDGLSFVVLDAIRDQINVSPLKKDKDVAIEPVAVSSPKKDSTKFVPAMPTSPAALTSAGSASGTLNYTLPFAMGGVEVLSSRK